MSIQVKDTNKENVEIKVMQFAGGERHVQVDATRLNQLAGQIFIQAQINNSQDLMDYLLIENVLLNQGLELHVEMPYFPYARQDRICATGQAFSLDIMTKLLNINTEKFPQQRKSITVWDAHSATTAKRLNENTQFLKIENVQPSEIIAQDAKLMNILIAENSVLVCPDAGAKLRTANLATAINPLRNQNIEIIQCEKKRNPLTGKLMNSQVNATDLTGKTAVICDDICDGGATFIGIAEELIKLNCAYVVLYVTHGIFSKGMQVFDGLVDQIFTTNSLTQQHDKNLNIIYFNRE
ncbi:phosphoribosyltransferase family protein [Acinetobacter rongchengensis]|uniref:Ribose-phosphate pyrophosphokinase n=1 Tax=Acinetobacter rongchengensis TaxID=2419601 RepID=A0A3A8FCL5_9GAMM|nr:phosphoribosyltransferase family protein [Acinetobacter rongchengensis]RKG40114.1 ribose-phosphate pyrophosphokinase [Acinetobacter rongchengensis]